MPRSERGRKLASLKASERRDAARGERYQHSISAHAATCSSVRLSSQPGQGRCSPTRTTRASTAAAAAAAAATVASAERNGGKEQCPHCNKTIQAPLTAQEMQRAAVASYCLSFDCEISKRKKEKSPQKLQPTTKVAK